MKLTDFTIGTRLAFAFGIVVLLSLGSAVLALQELALVEHNLDDIVTDNNVKVRLNNEMAESVHVVSRVMRSMVLLHDPAQIQAEEAKLVKARDLYQTSWSHLQQLPASEAGRELRAKIKALAETATPLSDRVIALAHAGNDEAAVTLLLKEAGPATQRWQDALDENIAFQEANTHKQHQAALTDYSDARALLIGTSAAGMVIAALLGWLITRSITGPMSRARAAAIRLAAGDLGTPLQAEGRDETAQLLRALADMQQKLADIVGGVRRNAECVATASSQIASGNLNLSQRTEEQASALEESAASLAQLGSTVSQNADSARQANQLALGASTVATRGGEVVAEVVQTMKGINDSSSRIADIIGVIDGIAFQTNILALNAAVEAARAGEQGRGFAVVATEVRSLAQRSAAAAKEIKGLITTSVDRVAQGTVLVDQAGATMSEIVSSIRRVADLMGEISAASTEQSTGVAQVGEAVSQIDQMTQQNAALVEEGAAAAESLNAQARDLVTAVALFKLRQDELREEAPAFVAQLAAPAGGLGPARRREPVRAGKAPGEVSGTNSTRPETATRANATGAPCQDSADAWTSF